MINHKYKCIFIHIPRTAGTSIEYWIGGEDWWHIESKTKHLIASQARKIYAKYWDTYFKFSVVRNPWDRVVSSLRYPSYFGIKHTHRFEFDEYTIKFRYPVLIEHDFRFSDYADLITEKHQQNCVYLNMLDEELDFIAKFEHLEQDMRHVQETLGIENNFPLHEMHGRSWRRPQYREYYNKDDMLIVQNLYRNDIRSFGYDF